MIWNTVILLASIMVSVTRASFNYESRENVAVYWGQNTISTVSNGQASEKNLTEYCLQDTVDIVLLSFLSVFPGTSGIPTLVLDEYEYSEQYQDQLTVIASQIQTCQDNGKIIMLSLGGEGSSYGFDNDTQAEDFAETLWQMFGDANSTEQVRPFGEVKVDGFDLDIETNSSVGFQALGDSLRSKFNDASKTYYLSAAPQCPYPEAALGATLNNTFIDFAFIQFYNNPLNCDANTDYFNWNTWAQYAQDVSQNKDIKLYMGIPGSSASANSGYFSDTLLLKEKVELASTNATFGGIMIWDASTAENNTAIDGKSYITAVKNILKKDLNKHYYANGTYEKASSFGTSLKVDYFSVLFGAFLVAITSSLL